jgi:hypothetical protein
MSKNGSGYSSRRNLSASRSPRLRSVAKSSSRYSPTFGSRREALIGASALKYGNPTLLNQDRVEQKFGIDLSRSPDWYHDEEYDVEDAVHSPSEREYVGPEIQYELNLKTTDELERDLVHQIRRYRYATEVMAAAAVMWDDLMEDIEDDDYLAQEFAKFQMIRKLKGGQL